MTSSLPTSGHDQNATTIFLKKYLRQVLFGVGLLLVAMIAAAFVWGIATISVDISQAVSPNNNAPTVTSFNLPGAAKLNFKGLNNPATQ